MSSFDEIKLESGEILFKAGAPADKLYFIQSGTIQMADKSTGAVFATLREGDSFGEQAMLQGGIRGATAMAGESAVLLEITAEGLRALMASPNSPARGHPKFPQAARSDYDASAWMTKRAAASLSL
jgi:CRP-like cAMP-binding protein